MSDAFVGGCWLAILILARWAPVALVAPLCGGRWLGMGGRILLAVGLLGALLAASLGDLPGTSLDASPGAPAQWTSFATLSGPRSALLIGLEVMRGAVIGFAVALVFSGIRAGFELAHALAGGSLQPSSQPARGSELSALLGVSIFFAIDGHHLVLRAFAASYRAWPLGQWPGPAALSDPVGQSGMADPSWSGLRDHVLAYLPAESARVLTIAVAIAAPLLVTSVLVSAALGLWQRVHRNLPAPGLHQLGGSLAGTLAFAVAAIAMGVVAARMLAGLPEAIARAIG